jgi:uncharacterized protein YndB with AHSA1/START domain
MRCRPGSLRLALLGVAAGLAPVAAHAEPHWTADPGVQQRLIRGEVVVETAAAADPEQPRGAVRAAVLIRADPEVIWRIMTDCRQVLTFVPGLRECRRLDGAADGRWEDIEQEVRYAWYLPTVRYVARADYDPPHRIDFHRISGDLKEERGTWLLSAIAAGATLVEYQMVIDPGFWIPQALVTRSLRKDLASALEGLRERVQDLPHAGR